MSAMFFIFPDTSAIEAEHFAFESSRALAALANAVGDGHVTVLMTDVTQKEIRRRIRERVGPAMEAIKKQGVLDSLTLADFSVLRALQTADVITDITTQWEAFLASLHPTVISVDTIAPSTVMDLFFDVRPPFSAKKPTEFRDAFVIEALRKWAEENRQQVMVVSTDPDLKAACDEERLVYVPRIADALAKTIGDEALERAANDALRVNRDEIVERIGEDFSMLGIAIEEDWGADVAGVSVENVELDPSAFSVIEVREGHVVTEGQVRIHFTVEASVADYDNSPRDAGDYVFLLHETLIITARRNFSIAVTFILDGSPPQPTEVDSVDFQGGRVIELSLHDRDVDVRERYPDNPDGDESEETAE